MHSLGLREMSEVLSFKLFYDTTVFSIFEVSSYFLKSFEEIIINTHLMRQKSRWTYNHVILCDHLEYYMVDKCSTIFSSSLLKINPPLNISKLNWKLIKSQLTL